MLGVGIVGCGLIGHKRAASLGRAKLVACADVHMAKAEKLASASTGCRAFSDYRDLLKCEAVDILIVATLHESLSEITLAAIQAGKHVLVEKPAARKAAELERVMEAASEAEVKVRVGFNHRYHRALRKAKQLVEAGEIGDLMYLRARYGHGGRVGYDQEWRADPDLSGGGELIDQGPHLIDLSRWLLGDISDVQGFAHTYYWNMPVDDNGFLLLKTARKQVAFLHVSCTEWKNIFSMEIYGRIGKLEIAGLGGSYGVERLAFYKMLPEMGPPETTVWEYPMADDSWKKEFDEFLDDICLNREPTPTLRDAYEVLKIIETVYEGSGYGHRS